MNDIIRHIKNQLTDTVRNSLCKIDLAGTDSEEFKKALESEIEIEIPKEKKYGDFSVNTAMKLTKILRNSPINIAKAIIENMNFEGTYIEKCEIAGPGFINFYLKNDWLYDGLKLAYELGEDFGKTDFGKGKKVMVEFVSANPTGPMHMGNARGGALGDSLASVLEMAGYDVTREFYINDAGAQIDKFANSLEARYIQQLKGEDAIEFPEDGYHGDDITEHAKAFIEIEGDKYLDVSAEERKAALVGYALEKNVNYLKTDLEKYRIFYDVWFRESELHKSGKVQDAIDRLTKAGYTYEEDGAIWINCEKMGLEKNEVLVRNNGIPTYFAADIAYHINKIETRGYDLCIDVWGADHHGHVARMKAALAACGIDPDKFEVSLMQLVRLTRDGEAVRMSKRTGKAITLTDLLEDVSVDAARFLFNMRMAGSHLDFDLDLAVKQESENPVYYVQYAHARICSIIRVLKEEGIDVKSFGEITPEVLCEKEEIALLKKLCDLPEEIRAAAETREPARITRYVMDLASAFHTFYNACRVKVEDKELMNARLKLVDSTRIVIQGVLKMLKITAPEKM